MKKLSLSNTSYRYLETSFRDWLDILGYSATTIYYLPLHIREFLCWLDHQGIHQIQAVDYAHIRRYYEKLKERANQTRGGALSNAYLNKHQQALKKFTDYLRQVGRVELPAFPMRGEVKEDKQITTVTIEEIGQLYAVTYDGTQYCKKCLSDRKMEAIQSRDRAMLTIFYGCGLRRNEGVHLDVGDINFDRQLLHVRKGKGYKERYVPFNKTNSKHLESYLYDHRPALVPSNKEPAFFISYRGKRMGGQSLLIRLKLLQQWSDQQTLRDKEIGLHTLRHSIATHLLQAGMKLENISRFLGHSSLESTQLYTHLVGNPEADQTIPQQQPFTNIPTYQLTRLHE